MRLRQEDKVLPGGVTLAAWRPVVWVVGACVPHVLASAKATPFSSKAASPSDRAGAFPRERSPGKLHGQTSRDGPSGNRAHKAHGGVLIGRLLQFVLFLVGTDSGWRI